MNLRLLSSVAAVAFVAASASARAADEVQYEPEGYGWSGLYVGVGVGAGAGIGEVDVPGLFTFNGIAGEGFLADATIGYDYMVTDRFLLGGFADAFIDNMKANLEIVGIDVLDVGAEYGFDVGARAGYMVTPSTLAYVLGGYTWGHFNVDLLDSSIYDWSKSGFFAGAGMETALGGNVTLKGEYRYMQYAGHDFSDTGLIPPGVAELNISAHTFRVGLNYHFNQASGSIAAFGPAEQDWSGFYVTGFAGASGLSHGIEVLLGLGELNGIGAEGIFGGGGIGYDREFGGRFVAGVEASARYGNVATSLDIDGLGSGSLDADYGFDVVARLGMKPTGATLVYALGGYSRQHFDLDIDGLGSLYDWNGDGYVVGGGVEAALDEHSIVGVEYRYANFETEEPLGPLLGISPASHLATVNYKYKF